MSEVEATAGIVVPKPRRAPRKAAEADASPAMPKGWVKIILEDNDNIPPTGLPIGINGKFYFLRPGEEAPVPPGVIEILNHAMEKVPVKDPSQKIIGYRDRMRYPYRTVL